MVCKKKKLNMTPSEAQFLDIYGCCCIIRRVAENKTSVSSVKVTYKNCLLAIHASFAGVHQPSPLIKLLKMAVAPVAETCGSVLSSQPRPECPDISFTKVT